MLGRNKKAAPGEVKKDHSHGSLADDPNSLSFDVGVDCHDFKPVSLDRVSEVMASKTFKPIDHHGA